MHSFFFPSCDHLPPSWPYVEVSSKSYSTGSVPHLEDLVGRVLRVFTTTEDASLRTDWSQEALYWATKECNPYASRSFQVCRALHMSLSAKMLSSVLARLVEHVADSNDVVQSYVMEVMLTLDDSIENTPDDHREYSYEPDLSLRMVGESHLKSRVTSIHDDEGRDSASSSPVKRPLSEKNTRASPERTVSSPEKKPFVRASSVEKGGSPQRSTHSAEARHTHEFTHLPEEVLPTRRSKVEKELDTPSPHLPQANKDADIKECPLSMDTPTQRESKVVAESAEVSASRKEVTLKEECAPPAMSPTSDNEGQASSPSPYHRRKHSRNQSMSNPISFEDTSPENTEDGRELPPTAAEMPTPEPQASFSHVVQQPQHVASPLSHALITKVQGGSSSQASSPCESPTRSPVRPKKQLLKGVIASTSRLTEPSDSSNSLNLHPPIRRKGSEPIRQRVHELKNVFSRGKRCVLCMCYICRISLMLVFSTLLYHPTLDGDLRTKWMLPDAPPVAPPPWWSRVFTRRDQPAGWTPVRGRGSLLGRRWAAAWDE